jgi:hypothetical protein
LLPLRSPKTEQNATNHGSGSDGTECCGAGAGGAVIKLLPGDAALITNHGSGSLLFFQRLEEILWKKGMVAEEWESR